MAGSTLSEWLAQTKKMSKSADYLCMSVIDSVMEIIDILDKKTILDNEEFFNTLCQKYHKPNPIKLIRKRARSKGCCPMISRYVRHSIKRCQILQNDIEFQWFEIIDFFFEKPHLVNPHAIDEYISDKINAMCRRHKKNNPLKSDIRKKFGKEYFDGQSWKKERRKRF